MQALDDAVILDDPPGRYSLCGAFSEIYLGRCRRPSGEVHRVTILPYRTYRLGLIPTITGSLQGFSWCTHQSGLAGSGDQGTTSFTC